MTSSTEDDYFSRRHEAGAIPAARAFGLYGNSFGVPGVNASYDYVVVGGGIAGLTIAARLAEDPDVSIAVVEAGSFYQIDNGNGSIIPGLCGSQYIGPSPTDQQPLIDWNFVTTPQAGADDQRFLYPRGKTLGGSSARNLMAYHRGTVGSYQRWADEVGDQSYTFPELLKYFQKSVTLTPPHDHIRFPNITTTYDESAFNNSITAHQPLQVTWGNWGTPLSTWSQKGMQAIGISPETQNFQSGVLNGSAWIPATITPDDQHRSSSQTSFVDTAMRTTSIKVYTQALAMSIVFDSSKTAKGVLVQTGHSNFTLAANKEVILSAGAFQSPQLLTVSGVGPAKTLRQYGIDIVSELPGVGQNMWDQPQFGVGYRVNVETGNKLLLDPVYAANAAEAYLANATGPLASPPDMIAFERISDSQPSLLPDSVIQTLRNSFPADWPELEYITLPAFGAAPHNADEYGEIGAIILTPFSRGNVIIQSADASVPPIINPNWLTAPEDKALAIAGMKRVREIWAQMGGVTIGPEVGPGANVTSDAEILEYVSKSVLTVWHASATCKMGKKNDSMAVVDSRSQVYGVNGLRVVDISAFPFSTPGHPQSGVYMLAEKIADDIRSGR